MTPSRTKSTQKWSTLAVLALGALGPAHAHAHFIQQEPPSWAEQSGLGDPQKSAPCGQADPGNAAVPTNMVKTYTQGQMITLTIKETITHPGHYRVSIAPNMSGLPADPPVTAGATACGSTTISANPTLPLIADGLFLHTAAFSGPQTMQIQLPPNLTCTSCTLQVTEFMSSHGLNNPGGCFYHHCATISIVPPDAAVDAAAEPPPASLPSGCSYYLGAAAAPAALTLATPFVLGLLLRRRRRTA